MIQLEFKCNDSVRRFVPSVCDSAEKSEPSIGALPSSLTCSRVSFDRVKRRSQGVKRPNEVMISRRRTLSGNEQIVELSSSISQLGSEMVTVSRALIELFSRALILCEASTRGVSESRI